MLISRIYKGFSIHMIQSLSYISLTMILLNLTRQDRIIEAKNQSFWKRIQFLFTKSTLNAIIISTLLYPLDTLKRQLQVNSSIGFEYKYNNINQAISSIIKEGVGGMYRGYLPHLLKTIPLQFIYFTFYCNMNSNNLNR